jgi:ubiquinone/menaquinone biosynthesis C-methylase UbiE
VTAYLMEHEREADRLERKTDAGVARRQLQQFGVGPGMAILDAGAGTGAVARVMAELVGPAGRVVALDASPGRLVAGSALAAGAGIGNLAFAAGALEAPPLREGSFDLCWSRFLFGYLPDPDRALARLARLVRPGGKVVVGEVDGHGLNHWPLPPLVAEVLSRFEAVLGRAFDPYAGRKLYHRFRRAGLEGVRVHLEPYHLYTDGISEVQLSSWRLKLQNLRPLGQKALGAGPWDAFAAAYLEMLQDPDTLTYSVLVFVEGVRGERLADA